MLKIIVYINHTSLFIQLLLGVTLISCPGCCKNLRMNIDIQIPLFYTAFDDSVQILKNYINGSDLIYPFNYLVNIIQYPLQSIYVQHSIRDILFID